MGRNVEYLAMKTEQEMTQQLIESDLKEMGIAAKNLAHHAMRLGGLGFGTSFLKWVASFAAIYLLILDRTNWKTNMLTALLVPYIFLSLPSVLFNVLRGEFGKWVAFIAIVLRLFFPRHFPAVADVDKIWTVHCNFFLFFTFAFWFGLSGKFPHLEISRRH